MSYTIELQSPLTNRQSGPGLILLLPAHPVPALPAQGFFLDPVPRQKWAEEGFYVASISLLPSGQKIGDVRAALEKAVGRLSRGGQVGLGDKSRFGLIVYDSSLLRQALDALPGLPGITCLVGYTTSPPHPTGPTWPCRTLLHIASKEQPQSDLSDASFYTYSVPSEHFVIPGQSTYDKPAATLAHQRALVFLRSIFNGPYFDIEKIWEEHTLYEFGERAVEKTMDTMVAEPYVNHVPTLTGGIGRTALTNFYANHFIFCNPESFALKLISRTIGPDRVVDEMIIEFTHDTVIDWMLPGIPPTGKFVSVPFVGVVNVRGDKLYHEHIYWDQASVLMQIGLLPPTLAFPPGSGVGLDGKSFKLPVAGRKQADKMLDPTGVSSNELIPS